MKYLLLYFGVILIGTNTNADITSLSLLQIIEDCKNQSEVDQVLIDQGQKGNFTNDKRLEYYYCCFGNEHSHAGYLEHMPRKRRVINGIDDLWSNWNLSIFALRDWFVNTLQYNSETVEDVLPSCVPYNPNFTINLFQRDVFQVSKCLSKKGLPVDVVSPNYVDRSVEHFNKIHDHCKNNHEVDENLINEAQNGNVADSESLAWYYTCYSLNAGFFNEYGDISYSYLKNWFKLMLKQKSDKVDSVLHRCYKSFIVNEDDVLQIVKCFADEKMPIDVMAN